MRILFCRVWAVCSIVAFCCCGFPFVLKPGRERRLRRFDLVWVCEQWLDCPAAAKPAAEAACGQQS